MHKDAAQDDERDDWLNTQREGMRLVFGWILSFRELVQCERGDEDSADTHGTEMSAK